MTDGVTIPAKSISDALWAMYVAGINAALDLSARSDVGRVEYLVERYNRALVEVGEPRAESTEEVRRG